MDDELNADLVQLGVQSPHPSHQEFFKSPFQTNSTYRMTKQSIYTKLQSLLNSQTFYHLTEGKSTIQLEEAVESGKVIIFNLAQGKMGTEVSQLFGRLIIALLQSIALRRVYQSKTKRKPTFLFIDECQNYLSATSIERILAESRKYGLHLALANQNLAQITSKKLKETILSNTSVKLAGANSPTTLQHMAKEIGIKTKDFELLKTYSFYLRAGGATPRIFKPPTFLLRQKKKYYLKAADKKALKKYLVHEAGHYIPKKPPQNLEELRQQSVAPKPKYGIEETS